MSGKRARAAPLPRAGNSALPSEADFRSHKDHYSGRKELLEATKRWLVARPPFKAAEADNVDHSRIGQIRRLNAAIQVRMPAFRGLTALHVSALVQMPVSQLDNFVGRVENSQGAAEARTIVGNLDGIADATAWFLLRKRPSKTQQSSRPSANPGNAPSTPQQTTDQPSTPPQATGQPSTPPGMQLGQGSSPAGTQPNQGTSPAGTQPSQGSSLAGTPRKRDPGAREACYKRDGEHCVLTNDEDPEVCHVVPFSWNTSESSRDLSRRSLDHLRPFVTDDEFIRLKSYLTSSLAVSDKAWNLVCLSSKVHSRWGKAHWAFKVDEVKRQCEPKPEKATVTLQFHWMGRPAGAAVSNPEDKSKGKAKSGPNDQPKSGPNDPSGWVKGGPAPVLRRSHHNFHDDQDHRCILTGDLFDVTMSPDDAEKFVMMVRLQWIIIRITTMAGAAGHPELLFWRDDNADVDDAALAGTSIEGSRIDPSLLEERLSDDKATTMGRRIMEGAKARYTRFAQHVSSIGGSLVKTRPEGSQQSPPQESPTPASGSARERAKQRAKARETGSDLWSQPPTLSRASSIRTIRGKDRQRTPALGAGPSSLSTALGRSPSMRTLRATGGDN